MSWVSCKAKFHHKKRKTFGKIDLYLLKEKYRLTEDELLEFKQRFSYLSNAQELLDKETFRENMGLLGLDSGSYLADIIFSVLDEDKDGYIKLEEYLKYFDILIYGSPEEKHELTFRMIDLDSKGWFTFSDFKGMILSLLYTWNNLTGSHYDINHNQKLEDFFTKVYRRFDIEGNNRVTLENFKNVVAKDPHLLEIFDYFNEGILDSVQNHGDTDQKEQIIIDELENLHTKLNKLKEYLGGNTDIQVQKEEVREEKTGDFQKHDVLTPQSEMKTPIVSSLDSKIKRTIFFEPFRNERDYADRRRPLNPENFEVLRRFSYHGQNQTKNLEQEEETKGLLDKKIFKSVELIDQDHYSFQINGIRETNESRLKNFEDFQKKNHQSNLTLVDLKQANGFSLRHPTNQSNAVLNKDDREVKSIRGEYYDILSKKDAREISTPLSSKNHRTESYLSLLSPTIPAIKQFTLKPASIPIQPKVLDPDDDMDEFGFTSRSTKMCHDDSDLNESIMIKDNHNKNFINVNAETPSDRRSTNPYSLQFQQVSEQLETLAVETLKIIEEIRNKRKYSNHVDPQAADLEESQMKVTAQNIPKVPKIHKGNFVSFGHQNWNLVLNMMLGIQRAIRSVIEKPDNFSSKDFSAKHIFELVPKRTNETKVSYKICKFIDYAPNVFNDLRKLYGIKNEDYLRSIGPETMLSNLIRGNLRCLSELTSSGKSGSFFYYSADGKYTLKTISRDEFHFLRKILQNYYTYIISNHNSLIIKFFGLHKIRFVNRNRTKQKVYFIIMANVFQTSKEIHERYDLKGSTRGRYTKEDVDSSVAKKDLNIIMNKEKILLPHDIADSFLETIEKDTKFFEKNHIIDYSLLMGVHRLSPEEASTKDISTHKRVIHDFKVHGKEGILSSDNSKLYFFGIIDILTEFNTKKKAEYVVKSMAYGKGISAVPPGQYAERFRNFINSLVEKS